MSTAVAEKAVPTEPGIYPGLTFSEYQRISATNHSKLEPFMRTPAHAREAMLHPKDGSPEMALGQAFHTFLLEPNRFYADYVVPPKVDRRTKVGKETWSAFEAENPGKLAISADELESYECMAEAIHSHDFARELLSGPGLVEVTIVWKDDETGLLCKARLDRVAPHSAGWTFVVDLKTARDAEERAFAKQAGQLGYFRQIEYYRHGLNVLRPLARRCAFIAVEKDPPYAVACHEVDDRALEQAARENRSHLNQLRQCMESGSWPAYGNGLTVIDYPAWLSDSATRTED